MIRNRQNIPTPYNIIRVSLVRFIQPETTCVHDPKENQLMQFTIYINNRKSLLISLKYLSSNCIVVYGKKRKKTRFRTFPLSSAVTNYLILLLISSKYVKHTHTDTHVHTHTICKFSLKSIFIHDFYRLVSCIVIYYVLFLFTYLLGST